MGAIAAANAAEEILDDLDLDGEEPIMDSRFTTTIPDEETTEMVGIALRMHQNLKYCQKRETTAVWRMMTSAGEYGTLARTCVRTHRGNP